MEQNLGLILLHFDAIIPLVIMVTLLLKSVLFLKVKTNKFRYYNFIYFRTGEIASSNTEQKLNIKIIQNALSFYAVFLVLLTVVITIFKNG